MNKEHCSCVPTSVGSWVSISPKSIVTGIPSGIVAFKAIEGLNANFGTTSSLLKEYLSPSVHGWDADSPNLEVVLIGFDCVAPESHLSGYTFVIHTYASTTFARSGR
ncbi:uncharacterized protein NFIA_045190 [Aspergillus fischeri NRRL 181]|uniref:Uncharacterized protein n=1 Tax=Neosartorya fischeri (strain ATCC 1020 / DSM 3700 / CBS 544.65 / FGSC A1164 / JCM 1740 / NRRL 181 / WB 181) TaxID=331117 RepID=A1CVC3_NEOFI|nr:uncharacterized protein NFIA_045190 [Aspergillus fischeri NRRL 181]EAW25700.1 hypothetical protein NFIA_045190 [Aspergillus fischeri NRRL 181]